MGSRTPKTIYQVQSIQAEAFLVTRLPRTIDLVESIQVEASWLPEPLGRNVRRAGGITRYKRRREGRKKGGC